MSVVFKEMGEYVIIRKTEFEKLKEGYRQYENKKEFSRKYMREKYAKAKLEQEKLKAKLEIEMTDEEFAFHQEYTS